MATLGSIGHVNLSNIAAINHVSIDKAASFNHVSIASSLTLQFASSYSFYWAYNEYGSGYQEAAYITIIPDATWSTSIVTNFTRTENQTSNYIITYPTTQNNDIWARDGNHTLTASGYSCTGDCTCYVFQDFNDTPPSSHGSSLPTCLTADTLITMANGKKKKIADIKTGDKILAADLKQMKYVSSTVKKNVKTLHRRLAKIKWNNAEIICTTDHPFLEQTKKWSSFFAGMTNRYYANVPNHCQRLAVGDKIFTKTGYERIESVIFIEELVPTWQIMEAEYQTYYANDLLTLIEVR